MSDFQYQVGDVVRFVEPGYNNKQQTGMMAVVRALSSNGLPIVDTDDEGETLGWDGGVEFVSRPSHLSSQKEPPSDQLTTRDQFAMAALTGKLAAYDYGEGQNYPTVPDLVAQVWEIADAMMEARK